MLTVAYPAACAIGGDLLALVRDPDGQVTFVNASGRSFRATEPEAVRSRYAAMPTHGPLSITVPGMVGGWDALWRRGATLPWADLLTPAVNAAREGAAGLAGPRLRRQRDRAAPARLPGPRGGACPSRSPTHRWSDALAARSGADAGADRR